MTVYSLDASDFYIQLVDMAIAVYFSVTGVTVSNLKDRTLIIAKAFQILNSKL